MQKSIRTVPRVEKCLRRVRGLLLVEKPWDGNGPFTHLSLLASLDRHSVLFHVIPLSCLLWSLPSCLVRHRARMLKQLCSIPFALAGSVRQ
jgi:hypothetical protein